MTDLDAKRTALQILETLARRQYWPGYESLFPVNRRNRSIFNLPWYYDLWFIILLVTLSVGIMIYGLFTK